MAHGLAHGPRPRFCPHPETRPYFSFTRLQECNRSLLAPKQTNYLGPREEVSALSPRKDFLLENRRIKKRLKKLHSYNMPLGDHRWVGKGSWNSDAILSILFPGGWVVRHTANITYCQPVLRESLSQFLKNGAFKLLSNFCLE